MLEFHDLACVITRVIEDQALDLGLAHGAGVGTDEAAHAVTVKINVVNVDFGEELDLVHYGVEVEHLLIDEVTKIFGVLVGLRRSAVLEFELDNGIAVIAVSLGLCGISAEIGVKAAGDDYRLKRSVAFRHRELAGNRVAVSVESDGPDSVLPLGFRYLVFVFEFREKRSFLSLALLRLFLCYIGNLFDQFGLC